jgi:hypothetical protein
MEETALVNVCILHWKKCIKKFIFYKENVMEELAA